MSMLAFLAANIPTTINPTTTLGALTGTGIAGPILDGAEILIPAAVAVSGIHKLMEHRETSGSLIIELLTKGGGTVLAIQLLKLMINGG